MVFHRLLLACCLTAVTAACSNPEPLSQADAARVADIAALIEPAAHAPEALRTIRAEATKAQPDAGAIQDAVAELLALAKVAARAGSRSGEADPQLVFWIGVLEVWLTR